MALTDIQLEFIEDVFCKNGLNLNEFSKYERHGIIEYSYNLDHSFRFRIEPPFNLYTSLCSVFCEPFTYMPHIYVECNKFDEVACKAKEWSTVLKCKLDGFQFIHKIFISHSSKDKDIVTDFVDKILVHSCGIGSENLTYTSLQSTGVGLGESIPLFIRENIQQATYVFLMISDNYKTSDVCMNEMGAAWALGKNPISILLPNMNFSKLGWLTSFEKAMKIDDAEALDKLYSSLNTPSRINIIDWNRQKQNFLHSII